MDDAPRIGGAQALFLIIGGTAAWVTVDSGWWVAAVVAVVALGMVVWLEVYAHRRVREEREAEEARFRRTAIAHLDFKESAVDDAD
jgi:membrane protein implicated in regulation of membrane protease activity